MALSTNEKEYVASWVLKMIKRAEINDIEGNFRRTWLLVDLLKYYFELRDQWYMGPKRSFQVLKETDRETYTLFEKSLQNPTDLVILKDLAAKITADLYLAHLL